MDADIPKVKTSHTLRIKKNRYKDSVKWCKERGGCEQRPRPKESLVQTWEALLAEEWQSGRRVTRSDGASHNHTADCGSFRVTC